MSKNLLKAWMDGEDLDDELDFEPIPTHNHTPDQRKDNQKRIDLKRRARRKQKEAVFEAEPETA